LNGRNELFYKYEGSFIFAYNTTKTVLCLRYKHCLLPWYHYLFVLGAKSSRLFKEGNKFTRSVNQIEICLNINFAMHCDHCFNFFKLFSHFNLYIMKFWHGTNQIDVTINSYELGVISVVKIVDYIKIYKNLKRSNINRCKESCS